MIGLGSNRLTVCRRGGMRVTQAGRGGMEWLAGGRLPRWATPYSAQATAALLAQFPTQWPTIRDYGFAHPEIVGYMNAYAPEDAKIAYSLVEGIGTRWLVGDGTAYIDTLYVHKSTTAANITYKCDTRRNWACLFGYRNVSYSANAYNFWNGWSSAVHCYSRTGNEKAGTVAFEADAKYHAETSGLVAKIYKNGALSETITSTGKNNGGLGTWFLFSCNKAGSATGKQTECTTQAFISDFEILESGEMIKHFVPFKRNGAMGMIDLLTGTFYGNANSSGSFTESIETPAS